jgi:hypothetical protein
MGFRHASLILIAACELTGNATPGTDSDVASTSTGGATEGDTAGTQASTTDAASEDSSEASSGEPDVPPDVIDEDAFYVAVDGDDANPGTLEQPFATIGHAIAVVAPDGTIYVRGGTYLLDHTLVLAKTGPILLAAYPDESPILDFSANPRHANPPQPRDDDSIAATGDAVGILVPGDASGWHLRGLTIRNAAYYGVRVYGSDNIFEELVLHDNKASGLEITGKDGFSPSDNLVLECDSFHNFDPQSNGEDADGFAAKFDTLGPGNAFRGCRAWSNADDGYDFWHASPVLVQHCWSFDNGYNRDEWASQLTDGWQGDGMGFKLGQDAAEIELDHIAAWGNKAFGLDENGNGSDGGVRIANATLVNNASDGNAVQIDLDDGRPHTVRNSIALDIDGTGVTHFSGPVDHTSNSWNGIGVDASDFVDLDMTTLFDAAIAPRDPEGALPSIGLHLAPDSDLIDAGTDIGLPYEGTAPDLGAFETRR